jgi:di/tricarboxylate transporter
LTATQALSFAIIAITVVMFAWGRFRYDLISLSALLVAVITGDVKPADAFTGFSSDVVIIIASALIISAAVSRSRIIEPLVQPLVKHLQRPSSQVPVLAGATALFAMLTKNVGALAMMLPVATRLGRSKESSPSLLLMPMSFMSLLGGLVTLVGTSTNIIVSSVRKEELGRPFAMFDFAPVGLALTAVGLVFVSFGWRLLPRDRQPQGELGEVTATTAYVTEARVPDIWSSALSSVDQLDLAAGGLRLVGVVGPDGKHRTPLPDAALTSGTVLLIEGNDDAIAALFSRLPLEQTRSHKRLAAAIDNNEETRAIEVVVEPHSLIAGRTATELGLQQRYGLKLLAISRREARIAGRLADEPLQAGDMLMLQVGESGFADSLTELGLLPLAERGVMIGDRRARYGPAIIIAGAIVLIALNLLPVAIAFFGAAVLVVMTGSLTMREAYNSLEPEVLILIGALTPLSEAVQHNGGTALVGHALASLLSHSSPTIVLGGMLVSAMIAAPFLHNAPTVLVLAPIGVTLAQRLGLNPDAFLMAVATGAGCDFLTPIGHQCNTLVRGPGGYRFGDYWRLGLPLSVIVVVCGTLLIGQVWGVHAPGKMEPNPAHRVSQPSLQKRA